MNEEARATEQSDQTKIALIGKDIGFINKNIDEIKQDIKNLTGFFVLNAKYEDDRKADNLRFAALEKSSALWKWLSPSLAAILGSVLTFLIVNFLNNIK